MSMLSMYMYTSFTHCYINDKFAQQNSIQIFQFCLVINKEINKTVVVECLKMSTILILIYMYCRGQRSRPLVHFDLRL